MVGIWVAANIVAGIQLRTGQDVKYTLLYLFVVAAALTVVNRLVRPPVKFLTFPLYVVTLGLFSVVVNGLMFALAGWLAGWVDVPLTVNGWFPAILGGTLTALISWVVTGLLKALFGSDAEANN